MTASARLRHPPVLMANAQRGRRVVSAARPPDSQGRPLQRDVEPLGNVRCSFGANPSRERTRSLDPAGQVHADQRQRVSVALGASTRRIGAPASLPRLRAPCFKVERGVKHRETGFGAALCRWSSEVSAAGMNLANSIGLWRCSACLPQVRASNHLGVTSRAFRISLRRRIPHSHRRVPGRRNRLRLRLEFRFME